jgi:hypothetical protein
MIFYVDPFLPQLQCLACTLLSYLDTWSVPVSMNEIFSTLFALVGTTLDNDYRSLPAIGSSFFFHLWI